MLRIAVLDDYQDVARSAADWSSLDGIATVHFFKRPLGSEVEIARALAGFDVVCLLRERTDFPRSLIQSLPNLKLIAATGAHNRTLDTAAAAECGIAVAYTRNANTEYPTSELTWGLILSALRHIPQEVQQLKEGRWQTTVGSTLFGKTLGILGLGRLGTRVAGIGKAFGMSTIAWSQNLTAEAAAEKGVEWVSKEELFRRSDVLTLHCVLSERTRSIVGRDELALMRPTSVLVNTSRGPLVDQAALIDALAERRIATAALDVFDIEPLPIDHPLRRLDNVMMTPHLGYVTDETYRTFYADTVANICKFVAERQPASAEMISA